MSRIEGIDQFFGKLSRFEDDVASNIDTAIETEVLAMQVEAAQLVPVDTGKGQAAIMDPQAVRIGESPDGPGRRIIFGLDPKPIARRAYHLFWVEFGTKAAAGGTERAAGYDKKGRKRWRKVKRSVPARPAQPFWRPAEANMWRRLQNRLNIAQVVQVAKRAAGLADQS